LGESDFVKQVLSKAEEKFTREYELKQKGYDLERVGKRVAELYGIEAEELYLQGRKKVRSEARSLMLYWAVRELGMSGTALAERLGMSQPGVVYAVNNGEKIARKRKYQLLK